MSENVEYEMSYNGNGVSITEYNVEGSRWTVNEEWWFTWPEVFAELTGVEENAPSIV